MRSARSEVNEVASSNLVIPTARLTAWTLIVVSDSYVFGNALVLLVSVATVVLLPPASLLLGIIASVRIRRSDGVLTSQQRHWSGTTSTQPSLAYSRNPRLATSPSRSGHQTIRTLWMQICQ